MKKYVTKILGGAAALLALGLARQAGSSRDRAGDADADPIFLGAKWAQIFFRVPSPRKTS